jgi:hypothetical protein
VTLGLLGRATAGVGVVCGLLALGLRTLSFSGFSSRYVQDGTAAAFLLITLAFASHFPAEIGSDVRGAALGAAAFGFLLFVPAHQAFDQLDTLDAGAWLGLCTILIPLGLLIVERDPGHAHAAGAAPRPSPTDPRRVVWLAGLVLVVVGVWLPVDSGGDSYWNASHTLGILLLLVAALSLLTLWRGASDHGLLVASMTFGLVVYPWVQHAFEQLGSLGSGGWLEAVGGLLLLLGVLAARRLPVAAVAPAPAPAQ